MIPYNLESLCEKAQTSNAPVATVFAFIRSLFNTHTLLTNTSIKTTTVTNLPRGDQFAHRSICSQIVSKSIKQFIHNLADEIDVVLTYETLFVWLS